MALSSVLRDRGNSTCSESESTELMSDLNFFSMTEVSETKAASSSFDADAVVVVKDEIGRLSKESEITGTATGSRGSADHSPASGGEDTGTYELIADDTKSKSSLKTKIRKLRLELDAVIAENQKMRLNLEEKENTLETAGSLGQQLIHENDDLELRLHESRQRAKSSATASQEFKEKLELVMSEAEARGNEADECRAQLQTSKRLYDELRQRYEELQKEAAANAPFIRRKSTLGMFPLDSSSDALAVDCGELLAIDSVSDQLQHLDTSFSKRILCSDFVKLVKANARIEECMDEEKKRVDSLEEVIESQTAMIAQTLKDTREAQRKLEEAMRAHSQMELQHASEMEEVALENERLLIDTDLMSRTVEELSHVADSQRDEITELRTVMATTTTSIIMSPTKVDLGSAVLSSSVERARAPSLSEDMLDTRRAVLTPLGHSRMSSGSCSSRSSVSFHIEKALHSDDDYHYHDYDGDDAIGAEHIDADHIGDDESEEDAAEDLHRESELLDERQVKEEDKENVEHKSDDGVSSAVADDFCAPPSTRSRRASSGGFLRIDLGLEEASAGGSAAVASRRLDAKEEFIKMSITAAKIKHSDENVRGSLVYSKLKEANVDFHLVSDWLNAFFDAQRREQQSEDSRQLASALEKASVESSPKRGGADDGVGAAAKSAKGMAPKSAKQLLARLFHKTSKSIGRGTAKTVRVEVRFGRRVFEVKMKRYDTLQTLLETLPRVIGENSDEMMFFTGSERLDVRVPIYKNGIQDNDVLTMVSKFDTDKYLAQFGKAKTGESK